ncbi:unnamed protein product [Lupinus luteus]|uniref:Uncharacterized protein n=1 Tax=Lupinus luteus TaxID=3873 RepID=A0AAV1VUG7_LUPLU
MSTPPLSRGMKMLELSGMTHLCKGLVVVLVTAYILIHLFPSALTYLALVPAIEKGAQALEERLAVAQIA